MAYELVSPDEYLKDLKNALDADEHNLLFLNFINTKCLAEKKEFKGLVYDSKYDRGAMLVFVKSDKPHAYSVSNVLDQKKKGFLFAVLFGRMYPPLYVYESDYKKEEYVEAYKQRYDKSPTKKDLESIFGKEE